METKYKSLIIENDNIIVHNKKIKINMFLKKIIDKIINIEKKLR
jgi:hypothetical protein